MKERIYEKIKEVHIFLEELEEIIPSTFDEYYNDLKSKAACERYFEKIIEAVVDLSFMIIKDKGLRIPEDEKQSFDILEKSGLISKVLSDRLQKAKGMRNILVHEYGSIEDSIVFEAIHEKLRRDIEEFLESMEKMKK